MSAVAVYEELTQARPERRSHERPTGISLGQLLARAYKDVHSEGVTDCPVCDGVLERAGVKAVCTSCGSHLS